MAQLCLEKFWVKWTEAGSKNTVGLYDYNCAKDALVPHKETTTQCSKRYNKVRLAQVGAQYTSMCGVGIEKSQVISAMLAL